jgi:dUTP pyrophosphatase
MVKMSGGALDRDSIRQLLGGPSPLVEDLLSPDDQLQPNGLDLTLREVARLTSPGHMGRDPQDREVSQLQVLHFGPDGWLELDPGPYLVTFNEIVNLPPDLMALGRPRSSLLRSGVSVHTAVWDAGYRGRSQALLSVLHSGGYRVQRGARLLQLVFFTLVLPAQEGYAGRYLGENI